ncbi:2-amino-4-hydroxy-6-hydroxymethyldihydropteridine diphosphokinase [Rubrivivax rivuli]|uniref:2-amino-4-hydroxy-6-hydroxymethyldihydropteridine pyrophosphokinase n=1 Tax=Rubrivivax rivuli TaxID=1862385 RepID=A0A437RHS5_9BURK|nr:2-amino-4-hydroxy-6-hydroxymethyldihydropteridine diphosphokinase [Rubrivivax rivuli]RVU46333.1 2-amino-4-hydroxy-6-hydroxymethyldihydropteridine diphosphokinase [Rubrivivax rivuli]
MSPRVRACIGLGANLGDARATLRAAVTALAALPETRLLQVSGLYRSAPVEAQGPDFLNAVACVETALAPNALLQALQAIEQQHGRERPYRNAPRTLDLDLLLHGDTVLCTPELTLPHPRLHLRHFVLAPLLELCPAQQHPQLGALQAWLPHVADQALQRLPETLWTPS